jgi:hypothetical protein
VFPCREGGKQPSIDRWEQRASAEPGHVRQAWEGPYAGHNYGIACGPSGLVVIDLDTAAHGGELPEEWRLPGVRDGRGVLAELARRADRELPATYAVDTPSGGLHLYYAATPGREIRNSAGKIGPMIDVRGAGGYVLGRGSVIGGVAYTVADDSDPAALPGWLADLADPPRTARRATPGAAGGTVYGRMRGVVETVLTSAPGTRNSRLYWAACRAREMVTAGEIDRATAGNVLLDAALEAGLRGGEREARRTIASGLGPA